MFLLRTAFWLTVVILILPADRNSSQNAGTDQAAQRVNAGNIYDAAKNTFTDLANICDRNPGVCETGQAALQTFGEKARYGAKMVVDFVAERSGDDAATAVTPQSNRSALPAPSGVPAQTSQNTLNSSDLEPSWGGPLTTPKA